MWQKMAWFTGIIAEIVSLRNRDVAARNFLVSSDDGETYQVRLGDFGMARRVSRFSCLILEAIKQ